MKRPTFMGLLLNRLYELAMIGKASGVKSIPDRAATTARAVIDHLKHGRREEAMAVATTNEITVEMWFASIREAGL